MKSKQPSIQMRSLRMGIGTIGGVSGRVSAIGATGIAWDWSDGPNGQVRMDGNDGCLWWGPAASGPGVWGSVCQPRLRLLP